MDDFHNMNDVIMSVFTNIDEQKLRGASSIGSAWKKILLKIKSNSNPHEGENLANNTRIVDLKNGILLVEAEHPGWSSLLNVHKKFILNGLKMYVPDLKIDSLAVRIKGSNDELHDVGAEVYSGKAVKSDIEKRIEEESLQLKQIESVKNNKSREKRELPPELKAIFNNLKKDMMEENPLTKSEK